MYKVVYTKEALKGLKKLPTNWQRRIESKVKLLANDPYKENNNIKKLVDSDLFRLRVGDYRIIYEINDEVVAITIIKIKPRGSVYK